VAPDAAGTNLDQGGGVFDRGLEQLERVTAGALPNQAEGI